MAHKKRERTRQQAKEKRDFHKFMLIKVWTVPLRLVTSAQFSVSGRSWILPAQRAHSERDGGEYHGDGEQRDQETRARRLQSWSILGLQIETNNRESFQLEGSVSSKSSQEFSTQ